MFKNLFFSTHVWAKVLDTRDSKVVTSKKFQDLQTNLVVKQLILLSSFFCKAGIKSPSDTEIWFRYRKLSSRLFTHLATPQPTLYSSTCCFWQIEFILEDTKVKHTNIQLFTQIIKIESINKSTEKAKPHGLGAETKWSN